MKVTKVEIHPASLGAQEAGIVAWVAIVLDDEIRLDHIRIVRVADGGVDVVMPRRRSFKDGQVWPIVQPLTPEVEARIKNAVFEARNAHERARMEKHHGGA